MLQVLYLMEMLIFLIKITLLSSIKSNLENLISDPKFFVHSPFGIKDALIFEDYLYLSFTNLTEDNCYNTSILRAKINFDVLDFRKLFYS